MGNMIESTIQSSELGNNLQFIREAKNAAKIYEWLYQCTSFDAFKNIVKSREIWLTNLKNVNDQEEAGRISVPEYENLYYVACFTYEDNIDENHWNEYGCDDNGILYSFKQDWVKKEPIFMCSDNVKIVDKNFKICKSRDEALNITIYEKCNPYYIMDFGFYKIVYDDRLKKDMQGECDWITDNGNSSGRFITLGLPGIIKSEKRLCCRQEKEPYMKDWKAEKEVRLKVGVQSYHSILPNNLFPPKIAIPLRNQAFDKLYIRFSPLMSEERREECICEIYKMLPHSDIHILE